ncbi:11582_t:CDS:2 [Funneliformis geosporum]|uniref:13578_t:CDS:1 n=1 Tax=Funneliformis geosporum TaxID=1117311 RepID=A0A9W4SEC6_9GLOM|nr:11582_t:CDS:2 [Funneliformis geosporum]CAI2165428.1 13578_t:CDS:2 [Funneliformis geosporum]
MSAVCFAHESYSLIVKYNRSTAFGNKKLYYVLILIYPILLGVPLLIVSLKTDAVIPRQYKCDVANPVWVRMLGYSGGNLLLSIPGGYFSARSAYTLYGHLDQFKSEFSISDASQDTTLSTSSWKEPGNISLEPIQSPKSTLSSQLPPFPQRSSTQQNLNLRRYNMTKDAAIRMSIFSITFMLVYFLASINTIIDLLTHKPLEIKVSINDWVGAVTGIYAFIVLFSRDVRRAWKIFR